MSRTDELNRTRTARRALWVAIAVVVGWFLIGSAIGPLAGKLSSAQENDAATFLPASAESTQVNDALPGFFDQVPIPTTVLFVSAEEGARLTAEQLADVQAWAEGVPDLPVEDGDADRTVREYLIGAPVVEPSEDGEAARVLVSIDADKAADPLSDGTSPILRVVESLRESAAELPGLVSYTTGAGGILADLIEVFGDIDTTLLGVTALVVTIILIIVYRSPFLWIVPLLSAGFALSLASAAVYVLATNDVVTLNGQSQGILTVLVFGAGTDYALLMVSRYREELHHHAAPAAALRAAWRGTVEPILASAATASLGLLMLLFSALNSNKSTGPIAAVGIASALVVMLTLLPALLLVPSAVVLLLLALAGFVVGAVIAGPGLGGALALLGVAVFVVGAVMRARGSGPAWAFWTRWPASRWAFWPKVPQMGAEDEKLSGVWSRVAGTVGRRPRAVWVGTAVGLLALAALSTTLQADGIATSDAFANEVESVTGQDVLAQHFPAGAGDPTYVVGPAEQLEAMTETIAATPGVESVVPFTGSFSPPPPGVTPEPTVADGQVLLLVTLEDQADSLAAEETVQELRTALDDVSTDALVGGNTAVAYDTQQASKRDNRVVIPLVLAVVFVVLMLLLRAVLAPVLLIGTVVLSFFAALGLSAFVFNVIMDFPGADASFPLFTFVFLVALGIDYNIFLMTRVREESQRIGTRPGILKGLTVTGGVITSAGIVLAATFAVLGVLPLVFLREVGFAVAAGVLLDTFIVRSLLVPALSYDIGPRIWWPGRLARAPQPQPQPEPVG